MTPAEARRRAASARSARLATVTLTGEPHLVPIVHAVVGDRIITAIDHKPKRTRDLTRLTNLRANPRCAVLIDHYDDDWSTLWWVRADGSATVSDGPPPGLDQLISKYEQYASRPPAGPYIDIRVTKWSGWSAGSGTKRS